MNIDPNHLSQPGDAATARRFAALAHPVRLAILRQLADSDACCVKDVVARVGLAQSTVSQHLKMLVQAGLVSCRPERQSSCYRIEHAAIVALGEETEHLLRSCRCGAICFEKE